MSDIGYIIILRNCPDGRALAHVYCAVCSQKNWGYKYKNHFYEMKGDVGMAGQ